MDRVRNVDDRLDESLIPLANRTSELRTDRERAREVLPVAGDLVNKLAWSAAPVVVCTVCLSDKVVEDLAINLKGNVLRKDARQLNLSVHRVVRVEILRKLWGPASAELAGRCSDRDRLDLDVNLWDCWRWR